jgi:hypothetical protein
MVLQAVDPESGLKQVLGKTILLHMVTGVPEAQIEMGVVLAQASDYLRR